MKKKIIDQIKTALEERKEVFLKEEDIQLYLKQKFEESGDYDEVFIEYYVPKELLKSVYLWKNENIYIDIVLQKGDKFYPIEIKYKTKYQKIAEKIIFGEFGNIELKKQGAKPQSCYNFWKDVKRIELFKEFEKVEDGVALFITNDLSYTKPPEKNANYSEFSIDKWSGKECEDGVYSFKWKDDKRSMSEKNPKFELKNSYEIEWNKFQVSKIDFHYILL